MFAFKVMRGYGWREGEDSDGYDHLKRLEASRQGLEAGAKGMIALETARSLEGHVRYHWDIAVRTKVGGIIEVAHSPGMAQKVEPESRQAKAS